MLWHNGFVDCTSRHVDDSFELSLLSKFNELMGCSKGECATARATKHKDAFLVSPELGDISISL